MYTGGYMSTLSHEMQVLSDKKILIGLFVSEMGGLLQLHIS